MLIENNYHKLSSKLAVPSVPEKAPSPNLFLWNQDLAQFLQLDQNIQPEAAHYFSGNRLLTNSIPVATAYSGHQFGHFSGQLGDGRAHLLGDVRAADGHPYDIQLKGSGRSPFSRRGDGKCTLAAAIREFLMSEAMYALGVPTTRSLSVVTTGQTVYREQSFPGAVITRIARSHIRVGSFQWIAQNKDPILSKKLADHCIELFDPDLKNQDSPYLEWFERVMNRQIHLIVHWMRIGFIHGVMNTDNAAISGETIDFGPCAMMSIYNPDTVFSSIDTHGRYRFGQQAPIAHWNLCRLAESLLKLFHPDPNQAISLAQSILDKFQERFENSWNQMMASKIGWTEASSLTIEMNQNLLQIMLEHKLDYTNTFYSLLQSLNGKPDSVVPQPLHDWLNHWHEKLEQQGMKESALKTMSEVNPVIIPRNHMIEKCIDDCLTEESSTQAESYWRILKKPYQDSKEIECYKEVPKDGDAHYQTYCGT